MNSLAKTYREKVVPELLDQLGLKNRLAAPRIKKVVVSIGLGEAVEDKKVIDKVSEILSTITGQKPKVNKARISVAGFKLRKGMPIGLMVTLRGKRMFDFLERLFKVVLARLRDFQGLSLKSFDGRGNYTLGLSEQIVFPEVDYDKIDKTRGLEITIVTSAETNEKAKLLLEKLGMPFARAQGKQND